MGNIELYRNCSRQYTNRCGLGAQRPSSVSVQQGVVGCWSFFYTSGLSSSTALGLTTRSLHQCCRAQWSHTMNCVSRAENLDLCLQVTLVHGSAVGTAPPKQPKINLLHI